MKFTPKGNTNKFLLLQREAVQELMKELDGKVMNYETCRMLEEFFEEYAQLWIKQMEMLAEEITEHYEKGGSK